MQMHVPPECQGQTVEVSYGSDCTGSVYRRTLDRSDRSVKWERAEYAKLFPRCRCDGDGCTHWSPWNTEPAGNRRAWKRCEEPEEG